MTDAVISPNTESMSAIADRINAVGAAYILPDPATYSEQLVDVLKDVTTLRVDVCSETESQLNETLAVEDRTSHKIRIWIRQKVDSADNAEIDPLKLIVRQICQRVLNFDSTNRRVRVWKCDTDKEVPNKKILTENRMFVASILLVVEVEAPA